VKIAGIHGGLWQCSAVDFAFHLIVVKVSARSDGHYWISNLVELQVHANHAIVHIVGQVAAEIILRAKNDIVCQKLGNLPWSRGAGVRALQR
jgi:hypothetical protein